MCGEKFGWKEKEYNKKARTQKEYTKEKTQKDEH